jgi:hypothetical protein
VCFAEDRTVVIDVVLAQLCDVTSGGDVEMRTGTTVVV